jgi:hypothetical protein
MNVQVVVFLGVGSQQGNTRDDRRAEKLLEYNLLRKPLVDLVEIFAKRKCISIRIYFQQGGLVIFVHHFTAVFPETLLFI